MTRPHAHGAGLAERREGADRRRIDLAAGVPERHPGSGERRVGGGGLHPAPARQAARLAHQGAPLGARELGEPGAVQAGLDLDQPEHDLGGPVVLGGERREHRQGSRVVVVEPVGQG